MPRNSWKPWFSIVLLTAGLSFLPLPKLMGLLELGASMAVAQTMEERKAEASRLSSQAFQQQQFSV